MISLFGFPSGGALPGQFHWVDGIAHCISDGAGPRLRRLAEAFELVWATGWEEKANEYLPLLLDLPDDELPVLTFDGRAVFGTAHWKLEAIEEYAGDRPAAWIDDSLDERCTTWAEGALGADAAGRDRLGRRDHGRARRAPARLGDGALGRVVRRWEQA